MVKASFVIKAYGPLFLAYTGLLMGGGWLWMRLETQGKAHDLMAHQRRMCVRLDKDIQILQSCWPRMQSARQPTKNMTSHVDVGETIKQLARAEGLSDLKFQIMPHKRVKKEGEDRRMRAIVIDFKADHDGAVARFIERCTQVFQEQLVARSFLLERDVLAQGDGEGTALLTGCYVLDWVLPPKKIALKRRKKGVGFRGQ
jgi:hypothetical protein